MIDYFVGASDALLETMGVDRRKLPSAHDWLTAALADHGLSERDPRRRRFYLAWEHDGATVGHSSIDRIRWGTDARAHLHLWRPELRAQGVGRRLFALSVSAYFERFALARLWVEPRAENPAPNRTLASLGFRLVERYRGMPGEIQFEQDVNRYVISREEWAARS